MVMQPEPVLAEPEPMIVEEFPQKQRQAHTVPNHESIQCQKDKIIGQHPELGMKMPAK